MRTHFMSKKEQRVNRRKDTFKHKDRERNIATLGWCAPYYVRNHRKASTHNYDIIPEHTIVTTALIGLTENNAPIFGTKEVVVPAKLVHTRTNRHNVAIKPYVVYCGSSKHAYKKTGSRKLRSYLKSNPDMIINGRQYRKVYDVQWEAW